MKKRLPPTFPLGKSFVFRFTVCVNLLLLFLLISSLTSIAQTGGTVSGTVSNESGETLPGVTVRVKGVEGGTVTGVNGFYSISLPANSTVLLFSYVGMISQQVDINNRSTINVVLKEDVQGLEEIVVVGYSTQKKVNVTGSVDVVKSENIQNRPVANVAQAIQGLSPNLNITVNNTGGEPGATQNWNIRGMGSLNGGAPYILVDGVPMDINNVNPDDVENISILKDAAASAIYGSRAPYGVILITTKRGSKNSKPVIKYSNNTAFSSPTYIPHSANSLDAALAMNYASQNDGAAPVYNDETLQRIRDYLNGKIDYETIEDPENPNRWGHWNKGNANNDWMSLYYKDWSSRQKHDLSMSGGTERVQYYVSGNFYMQDGQLNWANEEYKRSNMTANINAKVTDWMRFGFNTKYVRSRTVYPNAWGDYDRNVIWHQFTRQWPSNPLYYPNGEFSSASNVPLLNQTGDTEQKEDDFWSTFSVDLEPIEGWVTSVNYSWNNNGYKSVSHKATAYGTYPDNSVYITHNPINEFSTSFANNDYHKFNAVTSYEKELGKSYLKLIVGYEEELMENGGLYGSRKNLVTDNVPSLTTATGDDQVDDWWNHWATQGVFGRLMYNYKEKYLFELNARYDGSSKYENADTKWGFFPSASFGYNISKEKFWKPIKSYVNDFKIRASYGSLGNQASISNYSYIPILPVRTNLRWIMGDQRPVYTLAPGLISTSLTWETATSFNIGFDAAMLDNKLGMTFEWFDRTTTDVIGPAEALPSVIGTAVPKSNNAEVQTRGFELLLNWRDRIGSDFTYNLRATLSDYVSTVIDYPNPTGILNNWYVGQVVGDIWGYETAGYFAEGETGDDWVDQTAFRSRWQEGDVKYNDLNGDGKVDWGDNTLENPGDRKVIGNNTPRFRYGLMGGAKWKNLDFSIFWQGVGKREYLFSSSTNVFYGFRGNKWQNSYFEEHMDYWTPENTDAYYPRPYMGSEHLKNTQPQTKYLQNAAYLRLKSIQLGYSLPSSIINRVNVSNVRIYVSGENLITFTKMSKLLDPEALGGYYGGGKIYPLAKCLAVGISVIF